MGLPLVTDPGVDTDELGPDLDERQTRAVVLSATEDLTHEQIADLAGYATASACSRFLASERGRTGVEWAIRRHLLEAGRVGLRVMLDLAKRAKSENVRQMAAADLMNRARLGMDSEHKDNRRGGAHSGITISINTGGPSLGEPVVIEHEG